MRMKHLLFCLFLALTAQCISIEVSSIKERCMIVHSNDAQHFLKIDLRFTNFPEQTREEGYRVVLHDTETHKEQAFQVYNGTFRRQFSLVENVVYRLCFKIVLNNYRQIVKTMQYHSSILHTYNAQQSVIEVPKNLLKISDLSESYSYLIRAKNVLDKVKEQSPKTQQEQTSAFEQQKEKMVVFEWITILEILVIGIFGVFQFFQLKGAIQQKQR